MRLLVFRYLKGHSLLTLAVIVLLSSTLFSMTSLSLLGFYRGFTAYLGEGEDIAVLYDERSRTPFTGLVPAHLSERIGSLKGVLATSPEVIVPSILKGETVFIRGIVPEDFTKLNHITITDGEMLRLEDIGSIILGKNVAERLRLKPRERVLVLGVLTDRYMELQVKGIYASGSPMDDEALVPLYVGQWLRGIGYDHVTLIRFKIDREEVSPAQVFREIAKESGEPRKSAGEGEGPQALSRIPRMISSPRVEGVAVKEARGFMKDYLERYGVTRESILMLSVMVFLFSSAGIVVATRNLIRQNKGEIRVIRALGSSRRALKADLLARLLLWSIATSAAGMASAVAVLLSVQGSGYLQVLSHNIAFRLDPLIVILNSILVSTLIALSVLRSDLE